MRHEDLPTEADFEAVAGGWPAVMANLKSLLETGDVLPQAPWEMHAELREAQMARTTRPERPGPGSAGLEHDHRRHGRRVAA